MIVRFLDHFHFSIFLQNRTQLTLYTPSVIKSHCCKKSLWLTSQKFAACFSYPYAAKQHSNTKFWKYLPQRPICLQIEVTLSPQFSSKNPNT